MEGRLQIGSATVLMMDPDNVRGARRAKGLVEKGIRVETVTDVIDALKKLPEVAPDVLVFVLDNLSMDLDTLVRGIASVPRLAHLRVLGIGDERPMNTQAQTRITIVSNQATDELIVRDIERLLVRAIRLRDA